MKKYSTFGTQLGESVQLTDKAKLSLYKKSQNSGISTDILEEVYRRGYRCWTEAFGGTPEQFAFDRVNSFIADGFAAQLDEDLKKACWKGYEAIGMKKKNGKTVPNCVPVKEQLNAPLPPIEKIAKKFDKPVDTIKDVIKTGSKVEKEHTKDQTTAEKIAKAHVNERPDYYKKLDKAGLEEGKLKDLAKKASIVGALAGPAYDIGYTATHQHDPAYATTAALSYAAPHLKAAKVAASMIPAAIKIDQAGKGEDEKERQKKFIRKNVKEQEEARSKDSSKPSSRFIGSDELVTIYKSQTPGQIIKKVVKENLEEATYKGKTVPLNKPMKGDVKKSKVFVDPDGDGKAKKVNFGDKSLSIKKHIPARKKSYCARSGGQGNLTDKSSANYWSRRAWNCEETEVNELSVPAGTTGKRKEVSTPMVAIRMASGKIEKHPPGKSGSSGGGGDEE